MSRRTAQKPNTPDHDARSKAANRRSSRNAAVRRRNRLLGLAAGALMIVFVGVVVVTQQGGGGSIRTGAATPGSVSRCAAIQPPFAQALGFSRGAVVDTRSQFVKGLALYDLDSQGNIVRTHQDPTWLSAGYLGPPVLDGSGNIHVAPMPAINVLENPPERANIIYRVDAATGKMAPLIELPPAAEQTSDNAYGILGLTYDCETNSLYASSVYGSNRFRQVGRIYQIDLTTNQIVSQLDDVDAFGIGIFNTVGGKRLYFGLARNAAIYSIGLDAQGHLNGTMRVEMPLDGLGMQSDERVRLIKFSGSDALEVRTIQFNFNLVAPTENRETVLDYRYDAQADAWVLERSSLADTSL